MNLDTILQIATVVFGVLTVVLILLQQRGATLGAGYGSSGELHIERRGVEKKVYQTTIFFAMIFVMSIVAMLVLPK
ncbi:MAG: preprotein translocase subunit SecG [bacterium]|nr:preprotein translocase subunit SecG [bacterium]